MKQFLVIIALFATVLVSAQINVTPDRLAEYCPNDEYAFTVTSLPGKYKSIDASGGAIVTEAPTTTNTAETNIKFKGKFSDNAGAQIFTVSYYGSGSSVLTYDLRYQKVKSLNVNSPYNNDKDNLKTLNVLPCQTNPFTLNLIGHYIDASNNPSVVFGTITKFEYIIPVNWWINSNKCTAAGQKWTATGQVTITPDAYTIGDIQYRGLTDCPTGFSITDFNSITISRPNPTYTLDPPTLPIACGATPTQKFTVNTTNSTCTATYVWSLGTNNGWQYNGTPAPATITTPTNTLTLTSAGGSTLPASVYVTPMLNGVSLPQLQCTTSLTPFTSSATISGVSSICTLQSLSYFTINAGANNSVTWSTSNTAFASVITQTNTQATVKALTPGLFYTKAIITNQCGQTVQKTSEPITIGTPMPLIDGFYCYSESAPCGLNVPANNNYLAFSLSAPTGNYVPLESDWQWEKISGNFYFLDNGMYNSATHTGRQCNI